MAPRSGSPSATGCANPPNPGSMCCATSRRVVCRRVRAWPSATGRWGSGVRSIRSTPRPGISAAGSTRWATCSMPCPSRCTARRRRICRRSGWHRPASRPTKPSSASSTARRPNTPRRPRNSRRTARPCSPSSPSRPSTGCTYAPPTPSSRPSPPCAIAPAGPRTVSPARPSSAWPSR